MKNRLFLSICILVLLSSLLSGCGGGKSSIGQPIAFGDSYQAVYDFAAEKSVDGKVTEESSYVSANIDWFGDGDIYQVDMKVDKLGEDGLTGVLLLIDQKDNDYDYYTPTEQGERIVSNLKKQFGDPIGENHDNIDSQWDSIIWSKDNTDVELSIWSDWLEDGVNTFVIEYSPKQ